MTRSARFHPAETRRHLLERGILSGSFVRCCYRPFDDRCLYWHPETKLLDEKREDLFAAFKAADSFLTSRQKAERSNEGTPFYVTRNLPDRHLTRPGSACFPMTWRPQDQGVLNSSPGPGGQAKVANLSTIALDYLSGLCVANSGVTPNAGGSVWMHSLAIGYSPAYLSENADGICQDWPRIPLPDSKELLLASAGLGRKIAALLDTETPFDVAPASRRQGKKAVETLAMEQEPPGWWRYIGVPTHVDRKALDEARDLAVTAGWGHAGKDGVTMPGKGRLIERNYTPEELAGSPAVSPAEEEKSQQDAGATGGAGAVLLGDRTCDVYLNDVAYWKNIPLRVWEYAIGGYQVIKKWLSYREEKLLGRPMTKEEVRWVQEMARRIAAILLLEPALDENYRVVKAHTYEWPKNA